MRSLLSCALIFLFASVARASIDLTPMLSEYEEDGFKYRLLTFKHGERKIEYVPPASWVVRGAPDRLQLTPPASRHADVQIQAVPLQAPVPLDDARVAAFEQQVLRELPPGSHAPEVLERTPNAIALADHPTVGFLVAYQNLGQSFHRRVVFVHAPDVQFIFRVTAEKSELEKLYPVFRQSLTTWHWKQAPAAN
jgi:hypothetical protein